MMSKMSRKALRFEKAGLHDWIAWVPNRGGAYLMTEREGVFVIAFMPQLSPSNLKPMWARISNLTHPTTRDAMIEAQAHFESKRSR